MIFKMHFVFELKSTNQSSKKLLKQPLKAGFLCLFVSLIFCFLPYGDACAQQNNTLTVEKIMKDQKWIGVAPTNIQWSANSKSIFFNWNPKSKPVDDLYQVTTNDTNPVLADKSLERQIPAGNYNFDKSYTKAVFENNGDIFLFASKSGKITQLTFTTEQENNPVFLQNDQEIIFQKGDNLFALNLQNNQTKQLSNFVRGRKKSDPKLNEQENWLKTDQLALFDVLKDRDQLKKINLEKEKIIEKQHPKAIFLGDKNFISNIAPSADKQYISYRLLTPAEGNKNIIIPSFVTESGFTEDINGRTKVGVILPTYETYIFDSKRDTAYQVNLKDLPGIKDLPDYVKDYPKQLEERTKKNEDRKVQVVNISWSPDGQNAVAIVTAQDNKDRWIMRLNPQNGKLTLLDRQHDNAWIGGPGINSFNGGNIGWVNPETFYFQSEASGYSHIYVANVTTGEKKQITSGKFEVQSLKLSNDKKHFYFTANITHPGITDFYKMPVTGGKPTKITILKGGHEVYLSPDEKWLAYRYSYINKPWELYLQKNSIGAKPQKITTSTTSEFNAYAWKEPEIISFKNRSGDDIYARLYKPAHSDAKKPAVIFVHGAGYLQNVHYWWSQYSREYMFHNLLADKGYTVLDIDYTASSGYGRNHRTGIYRHMGGKDLTDQVDGAKLLVEKYGIDAKRIGIYGGSYGGFITLMAMFTTPDVFAAGAGLRSVTDWAHYNQGYTANILNEPADDPNAYKKSSPIYFADGLKGHLLMCHGMVDVNVHFQDIVRLSQRLIELKKDNWELAVYPVEDHGFTEPSSWTDEYKRILKLFEEQLKAD